MSSVEDKVVAMKFDNRQFEPAARQTMSTLDRLKAALNFTGAGKGLNDLQGTANRFNMNNVHQSAEGVGSKFSAAASIAIGALMNIGARAVDVGMRVANAFTLEPLKQGFQEYETNLNAVQTILANTQASGATLKDVNRNLSELNTYSDQTIYNFSEMARNIGTFTAAGVDLDTSTKSIKGIANLAALSGSNSQQASTAMYQLSQAISSGRVSLEDWNSVVNAGMGGTVFQRALAQTAEKMGTLNKGAVKLEGPMKNVSIQGKSFRESITAKPGQESWLTSKVLTETLKQFTGDMTDAELAAQGFTKEQIASIQAQAKTAKEAATEVKTFTQLVDTLKESAGSGWAQTFQTLFGDFEEAKHLWTGVNNAVGGILERSSEARNKMLSDWKDLGGRTAMIKGVVNIFNALVAVVKPIGEAFREVFPPMTGARLMELTKAFVAFTEKLKPSKALLENIKSIAKGFFSVLSIGVQVVMGVLKAIGSLFGFVGQGSGGFLSAAASVGNFLTRLDETIKKGDLVNKFFSGLGKVIKSPMGAVEALGKRFGSLDSVLGGLGKFVQGFIKLFGAIGERLAPIFAKIGDGLSAAIRALGDSFANADYNMIFDALNTALFGGLLYLIKKFKDDGLSIDFGGGFVDSIKETFGALTDTLGAMQQQIQAKTLMLIAAAVLMLTASIVALSLIDSEKLTKAMVAITTAFGELLGAMALLVKISGNAGFLKIPMIAASMILLAGAVLLLSASVAVLSGLSWGELAKGLVGVGALLLMIVGTAKGLENSSGSIVRVGLAMIPLAIGLRIMADAVKDFAQMSWGDMAKGLVGIAGSLVVIAGATQIMPPDLAIKAIGVLILSAALKVLASALADMGGMSWGEIAKALVTLAGSLLIIAGALALMTTALPGAAALIVAAGALAILAPALLAFSGMSWEEIGKGLVMLAGSLLILAGGLALMTTALPGAAALIVASAALAILTPVLLALSQLTWGEIAAGLTMLAGAFAVLGVAGLLLTPIAPVLLVLGAAIALIGAGTALAGAGVFLLAAAFTALVAAGAAGTSMLVALFNLIPQLATKLAEGLVAMVVAIANATPTLVNAFVKIITAMIDGIIRLTPKIVELIRVLIGAILRIIVENVPRIAEAALQLMLGILNAIKNKAPAIAMAAADVIIGVVRAMGVKIPEFIRVGTDMIVKVMEGLTQAQGRLLDAGARMIINMMNNLANTIRARSGEMRAAGLNIATAIIDGMTGGLASGAGRVASMARNAATNALNQAKAALGIHSPSREFFKVGAYSAEGMAIGLEKNGYMAENSAREVAQKSLSAVARAMSDADSLMPDTNPTITPVLDLTQFRKDASTLNGMMPTDSNLKYNSSQASTLMKDSLENTQTETSPTTPVVNNVEFKQYNTSPEALNASDIYRNTKSQLARLEEAIR